MKGKYLITTNGWFLAPDGREYRAAWGNVEILDDSILGIKTNRNSSNWYAKVGTKDNHVIIAGCQINYAVRSEKKPSDSGGMTWKMFKRGIKVGNVPNRIYFTE